MNGYIYKVFFQRPQIRLDGTSRGNAEERKYSYRLDGIALTLRKCKNLAKKIEKCSAVFEIEANILPFAKRTYDIIKRLEHL
ncbi:MAG: hypothetical protein P4L49_03300 [Desulfosporosinus sp.]|nr:hypothetical protein [Desulfosporosinus sp.]